MWRQGDVLVERIKMLPKGLMPKASEAGRLVLAYGEVTGHAHALDAALGELFEDKNAVLYLRLDTGGSITHEEHAAIALEPGVYCVTHQREYSPEAIRRVAD